MSLIYTSLLRSVFSGRYWYRRQFLRLLASQSSSSNDAISVGFTAAWLASLTSDALAEDQTKPEPTFREKLNRAKEDVGAIWKTIIKQQNGTGVYTGSFPKVMMIEGKLSIKIPLHHRSDLTGLVVHIAQSLTQHSADSPFVVKEGEIKLKVAECGVARILQFEALDSTSSTDLSIQIFIPTFGIDSPEVEIIKEGSLTENDLKLLGVIFAAANRKTPEIGFRKRDRFLDDDEDPFEQIEDTIRRLFESTPFDRPGLPPPLEESPQTHKKKSESEDLVKKLESMGAVVYVPHPTEKVDWGVLSGYEDQKRRIEDGLLLPLLHPEVFDSIAKKTRKHFASNRPRGVLFEGPPGTGKTTSARIIAAQAAVPLVYVPLEAVLSKFYGESEKLLSDVFQFADRLGGSIVFFDEIETLATTRGSEMHEATRRVLGVLLREMDGFDTRKKIVVIGATNRKQDLDPALLSRFDATIVFGLPDVHCREKIVEQYAQHLTEQEVRELADQTKKMSGRDIRDICEAAERSWASKIIRGEVESAQLPRLHEYLAATKQRHRTMTIVY